MYFIEKENIIGIRKILENQRFNRIENAPKPYPPHLENVEIKPVSDQQPAPKWRDNKGVLYGSNGQKVFKSSDEGLTWQHVLNAPDTIYALLVSNTGRIIISTSTGLHSTDEEQTEFSEPLATFLGGRVFEAFGQSMHDNYIVLSTYGTKNASNPPRQAFLSTDYGATFEEIFNMPIEEMKDPSNFHIHDVEYDPYTGRIWLHIGDEDNRDLKYSDDLGETWISVYDDANDISNMTHLMSSPYGLLLGSDHTSPGISIIRSTDEHSVIYPRLTDKSPRTTHIIRYPMPKNKIEPLVTIMRTDNTSHHAQRGWVCKKSGVYIMPFRYNTGDVEAMILASGDGLNWYHIYRSPIKRSALLNVVGFDEAADESDRYIHALLESDGERYSFKAKFPCFR